MLLTDAVRRYLNAMQAQGQSPTTLRCVKSSLNELVRFLATLHVEHIEQLDHDVLMRYREELSWRRTPKGTPLYASTQSNRLGHVRVFCRWMIEEDWLVSDPSRHIRNPRMSRSLPKAIMAIEEVQHVLDQPDMHTQRGFRDRVILEVLYTSAIRRAEISHLLIDDVDIAQGYLTVRKGKNGKDRVVPLGTLACTLLETYLAGVRADWPGADRNRYLFLNQYGEVMGVESVWRVVKKYSALAGLTKPVSTHSFRHTCATHMMRNGAPIRHLQEMLGHASIDSTQIYTRVTINDLRAAHHQYHPREQDQSNGGCLKL